MQTNNVVVDKHLVYNTMQDGHSLLTGLQIMFVYVKFSFSVRSEFTVGRTANKLFSQTTIIKLFIDQSEGSALPVGCLYVKTLTKVLDSQIVVSSFTSRMRLFYRKTFDVVILNCQNSSDILTVLNFG